MRYGGPFVELEPHRSYTKGNRTNRKEAIADHLMKSQV